MQSQQQSSLPRPHSPTDNTFNNIHHQTVKPSLHNPDALFIHNSQQLSNQNMYSIPSDFPSDDAQKQQSLQMNGFVAAPYRSSTSFSVFSNSNRQRHPTALGGGPFRNTSSNFSHPYPSTTDVFPSGSLSHMTSPTLSQLQPTAHTFESIHHTRGFDFPNTGQQSNGDASIHRKPSYGMADFGNGPSSMLLQSHQVSAGGKSTSQLLPPHSGYSSQTPFQNGVHVQSQTPYGPHLQTNGPATAGGANPINQLNGGPPPNSSQEEISTIFVVGFPEDMQEREFQNMFTFSAGFEAATLKIPNKEYNAYGGTTTQTPNASIRPPAGANFSQPYAGPNDPYNLVTVNQGGVVVDGGRDGTMTSWPATVPGMSQDDGNHFAAGGGSMPTMPPRKQIIGFAKFRSRLEALEARDVLQGRRVDIEKGAVLKAEMAKKNLHTKRGVGPLPLPLPGMMGGGSGIIVPEGLSLSSGLTGLNGMTSIGGINPSSGTECMSARERELGTLGAMGLGGMSQWREPVRIPEEDDRDRRRDREAGVINAMGLGAGTRGPRERAEEDERERDRRRKEKDARMRSANFTAYDAFHSVPPQTISRHPSNSLLSAGMDSGLGASPILSNGFGHALKPTEDEFLNGNAVGPWDVVPSNGSRQLSAANLPLSSSQHSSPHTRIISFSPQSNVTDLPLHQHHPTMLHSLQHSPPPPELQERHAHLPLGSHAPSLSQSGSSASSVVDEAPSNGVDPIVAMAAKLAVSTNDGNTSPQLPSPVSGASTSSMRNVVDQNPPINTLYVGNLPTSPVPAGYPPNYLEDSLRELFQRRPGFRKLCFRQKSNGPMCFVEFEDVNFATKALNDLYGNTLGGLVKGGGIRLSYSKNPLGVRTPTSAGSNGTSFQQQQQMPSNSTGQQTSGASSFPPDAFQSRSTVEIGPCITRRDTAVADPQSSFSYIGSPPPRFFSPTPPSAAFGNPASASLSSNAASFPHINSGFGLPHGGGGGVMSTFSPFGISSSPHSTIPASD